MINRIDQLNRLIALPIIGNSQKFFDGETAIFNGRSPKGICLPTGVRHQPFDNLTRFDSI